MLFALYLAITTLLATYTLHNHQERAISTFESSLRLLAPSPDSVFATPTRTLPYAVGSILDATPGALSAHAVRITIHYHLVYMTEQTHRCPLLLSLRPAPRRP